ncbi:MAG: hypothetical protein AMXMBFR58_29840 [Phycisphaerae bacterium]
MPTTKVPSLRLHKSGLWTAHWAGKDWYFSRDRSESELLFLDPKSEHPGSLMRWQAWRASRAATKSRQAQLGRNTVLDLYLAFLDSYTDQGRDHAAAYFRHTLSRLVKAIGGLYTAEVDEQILDRFCDGLYKLGLEPKTVAHQVKAMKTMWRWGSAPSRRLCPVLALESIRPPRVNKSRPEPIELEKLKGLIDRVSAQEPWLRPWLSINYLACLRPSEVVRLAYGQGELTTIPPQGAEPAVRNGLVILREHKMSYKSDHERVIPLSDEALLWYRALAPIPLERKPRRPASDRDDLFVKYHQGVYAARCRDAGAAGLPHRLRDSAATHLLDQGVELATVNLCLGHTPASELPRYGLPGPRILREVVGRLTLR